MESQPWFRTGFTELLGLVGTNIVRGMCVFLVHCSRKKADTDGDKRSKNEVLMFFKAIIF